MIDAPDWIVALAALVTATVGAVVAIPSIRAYDKRSARRQADADVAQAEAAVAESEATTFEIVDRVARGWIRELSVELEVVKRRLGMEIGNRRTLLDHVGVLEEHINDGKPPPPPPRPPLHWWPPKPDDDEVDPTASA